MKIKVLNNIGKYARGALLVVVVAIVGFSLGNLCEENLGLGFMSGFLSICTFLYLGFLCGSYTSMVIDLGIALFLCFVLSVGFLFGLNAFEPYWGFGVLMCMALVVCLCAGSGAYVSIKK